MENTNTSLFEQWANLVIKILEDKEKKKTKRIEELLIKLDNKEALTDNNFIYVEKLINLIYNKRTKLEEQFKIKNYASMTEAFKRAKRYAYYNNQWGWPRAIILVVNKLIWNKTINMFPLLRYCKGIEDYAIFGGFYSGDKLYRDLFIEELNRLRTQNIKDIKDITDNMISYFITVPLCHYLTSIEFFEDMMDFGVDKTSLSYICTKLCSDIEYMRNITGKLLNIIDENLKNKDEYKEKILSIFPKLELSEEFINKNMGSFTAFKKSEDGSGPENVGKWFYPGFYKYMIETNKITLEEIVDLNNVSYENKNKEVWDRDYKLKKDCRFYNLISDKYHPFTRRYISF